MSARMLKLTLVAVALALAFGLFFAARRRTGMLTAPAAVPRQELAPLAPDLSLTDIDDRTLSTSSLRGKVVVVNFWAAWCAPCAKEIPEFVALQGKYQDQGLQVIGVSIDDSESELRNFCRHARMNYPVVAGSQKIAYFPGLATAPVFAFTNTLYPDLLSPHRTYHTGTEKRMGLFPMRNETSLSGCFFSHGSACASAVL